MGVVSWEGFGLGLGLGVGGSLIGESMIGGEGLRIRGGVSGVSAGVSGSLFSVCCSFPNMGSDGRIEG